MLQTNLIKDQGHDQGHHKQQLTEVHHNRDRGPTNSLTSTYHPSRFAWLASRMRRHITARPLHLSYSCNVWPAARVVVSPTGKLCDRAAASNVVACGKCPGRRSNPPARWRGSVARRHTRRLLARSRRSVIGATKAHRGRALGVPRLVRGHLLFQLVVVRPRRLAVLVQREKEKRRVVRYELRRDAMRCDAAPSPGHSSPSAPSTG